MKNFLTISILLIGCPLSWADHAAGNGTCTSGSICSNQPSLTDSELLALPHTDRLKLAPQQFSRLIHILDVQQRLGCQRADEREEWRSEQNAIENRRRNNATEARDIAWAERKKRFKEYVNAFSLACCLPCLCVWWGFGPDPETDS